MANPSTAARAESKNKRRKEAHAWVYREKRRIGCHRCRFRDPRALDFHHLKRHDKKHNISDMVLQGFSIEAIIDEVGKCVLICANCHRILHWKRPRYRSSVGVKLPLEKMRKRAPKLCLHKSSGRGYATDPATRREIFFGIWGDPATEKAYQRWAKHFMDTHMLPKADLPDVPKNLLYAEREAFGRLYQVVLRILDEQTGNAAILKDLAQAAADVEAFWQ